MVSNGQTGENVFTKFVENLKEIDSPIYPPKTQLKSIQKNSPSQKFISMKTLFIQIKFHF